MPLGHAELCDHVDAGAAEVTRLLGSGPLAEVLAADVPSCPGWAVRDLVGHLGGVHRWTTHVVRTQENGDQPDPPEDDVAIEAWFAEGAAELTGTLRDADPATECWTLAPPRTVGFWSRRQAHETLVHRVDLADALGVPAALDPVLALDGVDEVVTMFFPRQVRLGRERPLPAALAVVDAASGRRWLLAGDGTGGFEAAADATVTATAADLLLLLWRRRALDHLDGTVEGDAAAARRVLAARLTP